MYSRNAVIQSVLLHGLLVTVISAGFEFTPTQTHQPVARPDIVQATVIDTAAIAAEVQRLKEAEDRERRAQEKKARQAAQKARELENKRKAEEKQVREREAERERLKKKRDAARKEAEAQHKRQEAEKKKAQAERTRQAEEAKRKALEDQRIAAEKDAERKRVEQALRDDLAAEETARVAAARANADNNEINRYIAAIAHRVRQSFTILPGFRELSCTLRITLIPGGEVVAVEIVKSSGNPTFDRHAENAVHKASPLPVPSEPRLFQQMRSISFVFDP